MIYLDYAAATPMAPEVVAAMQPYFSERFYNPSATYLPARAASEALESARGSIAHWLGARPGEIIFTAGGTESDNLAILGIMQQFPDANVVVSAVEHEAVLTPAAQYDCRIAAVRPDGVIDTSDLLAKIDDKTVLVSVMHANNEVGTVQPIRQIAGALQKVRLARKAAGNTVPLLFHTDAAQASNYLDLHVARLGVDLMSLNGSKLYGPKQSGVLYAAAHVDLQPLIRGGGQERGLRSGTENVAAAVGLAKALDIAQSMRREETQRLQKLQQLAYQLLGEQLPQVVVNGSQKNRLPNNLHVTLPGSDNERLLIELEGEGILAAAGSACSASNEEPSHVLKAMGISEADAQASLRFTMGRATTENDMRRLIQVLSDITKRSN